MRRPPIVLLAPLLLGGCFTSLLAYNKQVDGPWRLIETDIPQDRVLARTSANDNEVSETVIGAMVYAAGSDKRYIVAARHPNGDDEDSPDMARSEYYYIVRSPDENKVAWEQMLHGPLTEQQFKRETTRLKLPPLTIWPDS